MATRRWYTDGDGDDEGGGLFHSLSNCALSLIVCSLSHIVYTLSHCVLSLKVCACCW